MQPLEVLGFTREAARQLSPEVIRDATAAAFKVLAGFRHPDAGGTDAAMSALEAARELLTEAPKRMRREYARESGVEREIYALEARHERYRTAESSAGREWLASLLGTTPGSIPVSELVGMCLEVKHPMYLHEDQEILRRIDADPDYPDSTALLRLQILEGGVVADMRGQPTDRKLLGSTLDHYVPENEFLQHLFHKRELSVSRAGTLPLKTFVSCSTVLGTNVYPDAGLLSVYRRHEEWFVQFEGVLQWVSTIDGTPVTDWFTQGPDFRAEG